MSEVWKTFNQQHCAVQLTMSALIDLPFFLAPHKGDSGGVDYLGMRAINLQMMDDLLPGLNNVADHIRPFSLLAWTIWSYEKYQAEHRLKMTHTGYAQFREKIEALFILSHKHAGLSVAGVAGALQSPVASKTTRLRFDVLGRNPSTTLISAVNYGPGLKGDGGLHFAGPHREDPRVLQVSKAGEHLALGLDAMLREKLTVEQYQFLRSPTEMVLPTEDLENYVGPWKLGSPSPAEKEHFYARLVPTKNIGTRESARIATISLILTVLEKKAPLNIHSLRRLMTMERLPQLPVDVEAARNRWKALQLRQAQRLAMEVLFGWIERCIWQDDVHMTSEFAEKMARSFSLSRPDWNMETVIADRLAHFVHMADESEELFERGLDDAECDLVTAAITLQQQGQTVDRHQEIVANAFDLLVLVAVHTEHFMRTPALAPFVANPALHRMPLPWWATTLRAHAMVPFPTFIERMIETWLVSQHLGVAASRSSIDSGRMRLSIDDAGIGSLLASEEGCWRPNLTADRVETVLSLLSECGRLTQTVDDDGEVLYALPVDFD